MSAPTKRDLFLPFVSAVLSRSDLDLFAKFEQTWCLPGEDQNINFIRDHYRAYDTLPSPNHFEVHFALKLPEDDSSFTTEYLIKEMRERWYTEELTSKVPKILRNLKTGDPSEALKQLQEITSTVSTLDTSSADRVFGYDAEGRFEAYLEFKNNPEAKFISWGSNVLDKNFVGLRKDDLIVMFAPPSLGKTWWLQGTCLDIAASLTDEKNDVLFVSLEMSVDEIIERFDSIYLKIPYDPFIKGELSEAFEQKLHRGLRDMQKDPPKIRVASYLSSFAELEQKIAILQPSAVFIDSVELFVTSAEWQGIDELARKLRQLALRTQIPIICTTHENRSDKTGAVSKNFSDAQSKIRNQTWSRNSTIMFRMLRDMRYLNILTIEQAKARRGTSKDAFSYMMDLSDMSLEYRTDIPPVDEDAPPAVQYDHENEN